MESGRAQDSYLIGYESLNDDFSSFAPEICYGCRHSWNTNLAGLWQTILYVDGYLPYSEIDCQFGPKTDNATRRWQNNRGLDDDGRVGPITWGTADNRLTWSDGGNVVLYQGTYGSFRMTRGPGAYTGGRYLLDQGPSHAWHSIYFNTKTLPVC